MYCVETTGLSHAYPGGGTILDGVDLKVPQGSIYGFLGPNGAGKTTTLRLILGLIRRQQGAIAIFNRSLERERIAVLRDVGALIESPSLYEHLTAAENLEVLRKIHRRPKARLREVLELVGLGDAADKRAARFSLGMKQRLAIAMALLHEPRLLILDEPTNGLDPNGIVDIRALLKELNRRHGITILISSHLLAEIEKLVTHLGIISAGRLVFQGTLEELKQRGRAAVTFTTSRGTLTRDGLSATGIAALNRALVADGVDVHAIEPAGDDLEAIFMELIGSGGDGLH
ncbi:MAG: ABC transporter ATP-binding protein [Alphaproteobacteria bacterium]|nr:ABC transporter ATP-binding protein [Alphaproteobacteria bacterium]